MNSTCTSERGSEAALLIPRPQAFRRLPGRCRPDQGQRLHVRLGQLDSPATSALRQVLGAASVAESELGADTFAWFAAPGSPPPALPAPEGDEAYFLRITQDSIAIAAHGPAGAYYAAQTLRQLRDGDGFACAEVSDWPDLAIRGVHLDLKGCMPRFDYLLDWIRTLASFKINYLLVEYEDKFPYTSHPDVVAPQALTRDQLQTMLTVARDNYIEVVPLVQCLGHMEFVLKHDRYAPLREAGHEFMLCPLEPGAMPLFQELAGEVIEAHPDSRYFHLGADETWALGQCPKCAEYAARESRFSLYVNYVREACRFVSGMGKRPIIWDDMVWREDRPELIREIPEDVILCDWFYHTYSEKERVFPFADAMWISRQWLEQEPGLAVWRARPLEDLPPAGQAFARRYWDRGEWPLWGDSLPYLNYYKEIGREAVGGSAVKGASGFASFIPHNDERYRNVAFWARAAREKGILGVFNTAWSRYNGALPPCEPLELCWYPMIAAAELDWHADTERADFDAEFGSLFLGDAKATQVLPLLDAGGASLEASAFAHLETGGGRASYKRLLLAARDLKRLQRDIQRALDEVRPRFYQLSANLLPEEDRAQMRARGQELLARLDAWRTATEPLLAEGLVDQDAHEVLDTQTAGLRHELLHWLQQLAD